MPIHDWSRVDAGIFHDFHHTWIDRIRGVLNNDLLPPDYYALAEQHAGQFGPDVLALKTPHEPSSDPSPGPGGLLLAPPKPRLRAETAADFYRRKQSSVVIGHVSDDDVIAMIEIVSPGNKSSRAALQQSVNKAVALFRRGVHLLVVDLHPPGPRDPEGIHGAIWEEVGAEAYEPPPGEPLTVVAYESCDPVAAYIEPAATGQSLPEAPLFLRPGGCVLVPLEATYRSAREAVPRRWRDVIQPPA